MRRYYPEPVELSDEDEARLDARAARPVRMTASDLQRNTPNDMAAQVRAKVASGEYASESEVIRDGLRALQARDWAVEQWLRNEVVPAYDAYKADPSRGIPLDDVLPGLAARHKRAVKRG